MMALPTMPPTEKDATEPGKHAAGPRGGPNFLDRIPRALLAVATVVLFFIPIFLYFRLIHLYAVNAIWYDQWNDVAILTHSLFSLTANYHGSTDLTKLWIQHNENRQLFPNLIVLALGALTNLNVVTEAYLNGVLLVMAGSLIVVANRRDLAPKHWIAYLPLAFLFLTLGQYGDALFGFNLVWYLTVLALAATVFLLDFPRAVSWPYLVAAIAVAIIGSFSSLEGLFIWPTGLVILWLRRWRRAHVITWLAAGVATTAIYFYNFDFSVTASGGFGSLVDHPTRTLEFFIFLLGDIMGQSLPAHPSGTSPLELMGVVILVLAVVALIVYGRRSRPGKSPIGPALICFGLICALSVTAGRSHFGLAFAGDSRYVTFDLLVLAGTYLCALEGWPWRNKDSLRVEPKRMASLLLEYPGRTVREEWRRLILAGLRVVVVLLIAVQVLGGIDNSRSGGAGWKQRQQLAALVAAHAYEAPNSLITSVLFPNTSLPSDTIRSLAERAKADHLSFFATSEASRLAREALPKTRYIPLKTRVARPTTGSVVRGTVILVAAASSDYPLTKVEFRITGATGQPEIVLRSYEVYFGYLGFWSSSDFPNGAYTVTSIARDTSGHVGTSAPIEVIVRN